MIDNSILTPSQPVGCGKMESVEFCISAAIISASSSLHVALSQHLLSFLLRYILADTNRMTYNNCVWNNRVLLAYYSTAKVQFKYIKSLLIMTESTVERHITCGLPIFPVYSHLGPTKPVHAVNRGPQSSQVKGHYYCSSHGPRAGQPS